MNNNFYFDLQYGATIYLFYRAKQMDILCSENVVWLNFYDRNKLKLKKKSQSQLGTFYWVIA